ncbi:MAG: DedA family protein [Gammaproteobacteria bacterium]|nr:DedA family protein [Gammaproteobacteria bacterium]
MSLQELIAAYGYWAVFVGSVAEGETVVVLGGIAAHRGYLDLPWVMAAAFAGGWSGDLFYFFLGRRHGNAFLARFPALERRAATARRLIDKHHTAAIVIVRFLYGLRTVGPMVIGMSTVPAARFMALNALGALLWAVVAVTTAGYAFSNVMDTLLPQIRHYEEYLFLTVLAAGALLGLLGYAWRKCRERRS